MLDELGEERYRFLIEQFKPGDVYHADAISHEGQLRFCRISRYLSTPFEVMHSGGIFRSATVEQGGKDDEALQDFTQRVMEAFGMQYSASHTEFIRSHEDGSFYFLETSSRVGGAHLAEMIEAASGINLWKEWARLETAVAHGQQYQTPKQRRNHAGIIVSLTRQHHPDDSSFQDPEIVWRLQKEYHIGLIVRDARRERVHELLDSYAQRVYEHYHASAPAPERPGD